MNHAKRSHLEERAYKARKSYETSVQVLWVGMLLGVWVIVNVSSLYGLDLGYVTMLISAAIVFVIFSCTLVFEKRKETAFSALVREIHL